MLAVCCSHLLPSWLALWVQAHQEQHSQPHSLCLLLQQAMERYRQREARKGTSS